MPYSAEFFRRQRDGSRRSAREIVPLVLELLDVRSVVDVGCGVGTWLSVFEENGIHDTLGIDWHQSVDLLEIAPERFIVRDLTGRLDLEREFDLVVSLEVGEHLSDEFAGSYIRSLTALGPVVLFSAAIPYQGGTHHVNEQWPPYWVGHFGTQGYRVVDCIRESVWDNEKVNWFYAQNMLLFVRSDRLRMYPKLQRAEERRRHSVLSMVHPRQYTETQRLRLTLEDISQVVAPTEGLILVDEWLLGDAQLAVRRATRFTEHDGEWLGNPADDDDAIAKFCRLRQTGGSRFIAFVWPAFWWLEYYTGLNQYLRRQCRCVLENDRLVVFDLRSPGAAAADP